MDWKELEDPQEGEKQGLLSPLEKGTDNEEDHNKWSDLDQEMRLEDWIWSKGRVKICS